MKDLLKLMFTAMIALSSVQACEDINSDDSCTAMSEPCAPINLCAEPCDPIAD